MNTASLIENTISLSIAENWDRTCIVLSDRPLSTASLTLSAMSGEDLLDELPLLQVNPAKVRCGQN